MSERFEAIDRYIHAHIDDFMEEVADLCRVPSVSAKHEGVDECAALVAELLRRRDFRVEVLPSEGHPVVVAHAEGARDDRTMLFYNHYDVQPAEPFELWQSPPFEPEVRDGAIYARGAKDDKGELVARLAAVDALRAVDGRYPTRLTWLVEGEEEIGSPNLPAFVARHGDRLCCDGAIWEEGGTDADGTPRLVLGVRGVLGIELSVRAAGRDGHSGLANLVPNAAWRLIWALGSLKGEDERIRIPGFYDGIEPISDRQRELALALPGDENDLKRSFGLDQLLLGRSGEDALLAVFEPTCNVQGLTAGYQGAGSKTVIPAQASAKVDFRLIPGQDPDNVARQLRAHLDALGFSDVEIEVIGRVRAGLTDPEQPLVRITAETAEDVYHRPAQLVPLIGATTPMYLFSDRGVPVVAPGVGYGPNNLTHSPNEHMRLRDFETGARHVARVLARFAES